MEHVKLRLKLQSGAEVELSGPPDFIQSERNAFLAAHGMRAEAAGYTLEPRPQPATAPARVIAWDNVVESRGRHIQLRAKLAGNKTNKDACLVLLAAAQEVLKQAKPTAAQLAKWLRSSGYPVDRVDRAIGEAISRGDILASGSRRARRYELTGPGRIEAYQLASQLAAAFN